MGDEDISWSGRLNQLKSPIDGLASSVMELNSSIVGVRPANEQKEKVYQQNIESVAKLRGRPLFYPYLGTGRGRGSYVELGDGSVKMDLINGIGIHIMGHGHPEVIQAAIQGATADVIMQGHLEANDEYVKLSQGLVDLAKKNSRLRHCWLSTSGSMANENALKMARQKNTPARMIVAMENAFAGRTTMMAELTDNPAYKQGLPSYGEVLRVPFYDSADPKSSERALAKLKEHYASNEKEICAFSFEPMLGEGGYKVAPREYFLPMLEFCREKGIAVWADEIQTFLRTGQAFAFETLGIGQYIDLCTVAKTLQCAATFYTEEYNPKPGLIAGTFAGSTVSLSAGNAILNFLVKEKYFGPGGEISKVHSKFVAMLNRLNETTCKGLLQDAGGLGLMIAVTPLDGSREKQIQLLKTMFKNGLMTFGCGRGPYRLRFLLPAVISDEEIEVAGTILEKSILEVSGGN